MIALSESSPQLPDSASLRDIERATEAARLAGCQVYHIPQELPEGVSADDAMWHIPPQSDAVAAVWIGYIPLPAHYEEIFHAALSRNIHILNTPDQFRRAEEFDRFYPYITGLTAESLFATDMGECALAAHKLGYPVFVKGAVQSLKAIGLTSCVAHDLDQLNQIASNIFFSQRRSLGKVIVRKLLALRHTRIGPGGFPLGREYRIFIYDFQVMSLGYYWEGDDEQAKLETSERKAITDLAIMVSRRLGVPYLSVDIGQLEDGGWIVIEVGDGQFSGLSQTPIHQLWSNLTQAVTNSKLKT